jgi:hypothetical protein
MNRPKPIYLGSKESRSTRLAEEFLKHMDGFFLVCYISHLKINQFAVWVVAKRVVRLGSQYQNSLVCVHKI